MHPRPWRLLGTSKHCPLLVIGLGEKVRLSFFRIKPLGVRAERVSCVYFTGSELELSLLALPLGIGVRVARGRYHDLFSSGNCLACLPLILEPENGHVLRYHSA